MQLVEVLARARAAAPDLDLEFLPGTDEPRAAVADVDVTGMSADSREVSHGDLFACVPGAITDGHRHAPAAVEAGARALLVDHGLPLAVPQIRTPNVRRALGPVAAAVYRDPSHELQMIGVTGTNGKTSVVHLIASALTQVGIPAGTIGTLTGLRTTPEAPHLQSRLRAMVGTGLRAVAMEVSSHALAQHRVDATRFDVGVFTNLSPDHLDFHRDLDHYFAAKALLFTPSFVAHAVVNVDDDWGRRLADLVDVPVREVRRSEATNVEVSITGSRFMRSGHQVELALPGLFNIDNALVAAATLEVLGFDHATIAAGVSAAEPVPGRFEVVPGPAGSPTVVVDYAHTPDGLEKLLLSVRAVHPHGQLRLVFGCGGDRDTQKRPLMGAVAEAFADVVVVTSDNPRSEDPNAIISAVLAGFVRSAAVHVEPDRRLAIAVALAEADPNTVVVIAGKGSESTQTIGTDVFAFDDRLVAAELLHGAPA